MTVVVRPLECGWLESDADQMVAGQTGRMRLPVAAFLVEHPRGRLLFDTGMHPELLTSTERLGPVGDLFDVDLDASGLVSSRLTQVGCDPADIDIAFLSHLHYDHCGGLGQLPAARVIAQRAEWEAATDPIAIELGIYNPHDHDLGHDVVLLDDEHDIFGDGSVVAVPTPGHTPGHQSLRIEGTTLLVGDACYCRLALDLDALPAYSPDPERQRATFDWLRAEEARGTTLVFSHDAAQWATLADVVR